MSEFRAVLFDLDGTLLDTIEDLGNSMNHVLAEMGFEGHSFEKYKLMVGDGMDTLARRVLPEPHRDERTIQLCVSKMRDEYGKRWAEKTRPYPGIPELLTELKKRGIATAVFSNKHHDFTQIVVSKLLSSWSFTSVTGTFAGTPKKPDPTGAIEAARKLGLTPAEFLYVGDTNTDMKTANAAGMYPVGALWGFRSAEELQESGAKTLVAHPLDLLKLL